MQELKEAILEHAIVAQGGIVRVDMFLNHKLDTALITRMGQAFHAAFKQETVDLILTVESSGIALAFAAAQAFGNVPILVAKKGMPATIAGEDVYQSRVFSYTHGVENTVRVSRAYLPSSAHVLIVDDFLANGQAALGLIDMVKQADAQVSGVGIGIEKGFQNGGQLLREQGYKVVSLATVMAVEDGKVVFAGE